MSININVGGLGISRSRDGGFGVVGEREGDERVAARRFGGTNS